MAGRTPWLNRSDSRKHWPSVIEMTLVGMNAEMSLALVSITGRPVIEPPPELVGQLRAALEQTRVQVEHVTGEGLATRRAAQQQRDRAVGVGLLGQIVEHDQDVLAVVHPLLADGRTGVRRKPLEPGGIGRGRRHDGGVLHRAALFESALDAGDRRALLADRDVDAADLLLGIAGLPVLPLVEDRVDADRGLAGLAVADDQLTLPAADRGLRVDGLDAGLQRLFDTLTLHHRRCLQLQRAALVGLRCRPGRRSADPAGSRRDRGSASPTGTERTSPVRLTCWPCSIFSKSPRMTAPTLCSSRFSATPRTPPGNSRSSWVMTEGRPSTWAMPSPASITVPISSRSGIGGERGHVVLDGAFDVRSGDCQLCHVLVFLPLSLMKRAESVPSVRACARQSGSWVCAAASRDAIDPSMTSSPTAIERPPSSSGSTVS